LRGFPSAAALLRVLLLHIGKGYSLRETAVQASEAGLADVSDVTILNRLRQSETWWRQLCLSLLEESGVSLPDGPHGYRVRILDGTLVKEPGRTGSQWRIHYSLRLPSLLCDHFALTATKGKGTAEILHRFPAHRGDLVLADRAYSNPVGIGALHDQGAAVLSRWHSTSLPLFDTAGQPFVLLSKLRQLTEPGVGGDDLIADWKNCRKDMRRAQERVKHQTGAPQNQTQSQESEVGYKSGDFRVCRLRDCVHDTGGRAVLRRRSDGLVSKPLADRVKLQALEDARPHGSTPQA
jgi:hypothetical protein